MPTKKPSAAKQRRDKNRQRAYDYILSHPCIDCGEDDPVVLQFDHIKGLKVRSISEMVNAGSAWHTILREMNKCEVVCANCHARRTAKAQRWYRRIKKRG